MNEKAADLRNGNKTETEKGRAKAMRGREVDVTRAMESRWQLPRSVSK